MLILFKCALCLFLSNCYYYFMNIDWSCYINCLSIEYYIIYCHLFITFMEFFYQLFCRSYLNICIRFILLYLLLRLCFLANIFNLFCFVMYFIYLFMFFWQFLIPISSNVTSCGSMNVNVYKEFIFIYLYIYIFKVAFNCGYWTPYLRLTLMM
jgi:hypothetical protein